MGSLRFSKFLLIARALLQGRSVLIGVLDLVARDLLTTRLAIRHHISLTTRQHRTSVITLPYLISRCDNLPLHDALLLVGVTVAALAKSVADFLVLFALVEVDVDALG